MMRLTGIGLCTGELNLGKVFYMQRGNEMNGMTGFTTEVIRPEFTKTPEIKSRFCFP